ncbi:MAG: D-glycero-alpha-D-manno-heptose-1,7-bisphosphate 7-phosphatase [Planctomycetota bacterium]|jgi:D-glycero-D-manno-heptose 1,7-bisphosphate phosphatase
MSEKAIFLDRDDTLIEDPGYINDPEQVKLLDGVPDALIQLKALGYKLIIVTNQSAVAHGIVTEKVLGEIHDRLKQLLAEKNAFLDRIYYCPYHPEGVVQKYRKESNSRKPGPGMLLKAADEMDIDLGQSWCVGNSSRDIEAGLRAGCKTILIDMPPSHQRQHVSSTSLAGVNPDYRAVNIKEAVNIIKKHLRSSSEQQKETQQVSTNQIEPASQASDTPESSEVQQTVPEFQEKENQQMEPPKQQSEQDIPSDKTEELLSSILGQLKSIQRAEMFGEFSIMRLLAGIVQIIVLFCLLVTVWFLMSPDRQDNLVFIALGFAIVFQLMTLTFYIMQGKK